MSDFQKYWDTRIDANERFFNNYPHIANFAFSECRALWGHMEEERKALRTRVARLEEALRFILDECDWEESMSTVCGDNRIGVAARRALEEK